MYVIISLTIIHKAFFFPSDSLKICSYNINSVPQHLDEQCLSTFCVDFDVIGLCETRLNDNISNLYRLENYLPYHQIKSTQNGGLAIYLHSKFTLFTQFTLPMTCKLHLERYNVFIYK